jgi:glycosyltransferase involved in cell wall biosynthesis
MPRVSVIIPTYNRAEYLGAAIESVLEQTCNDLEIIVVDDGSTDGTRSLAQRYHRSIRYIYLDHCGLSGVTRNRGIAAACGAYIAFLDSDDLWLPNKIERQLAYCAQHPHMGMIFSNFTSRSPPGQDGLVPTCCTGASYLHRLY